jgi:hypothetical protein
MLAKACYPSLSSFVLKSNKRMTPKTLNQLRNEKLTPQERKAIAQKAARARWAAKRTLK